MQGSCKTACRRSRILHSMLHITFLRMLSLAAFLCVLTAKANGPSIPVAEGDNPLKTGLDKAVQVEANAFFSQAAHVGLSVAVIENGNTHFYNYGVTSRLFRQRPTRRSIYEIASITKTFTGALASMAILDGKMSLDDDFRHYLAEPYPNLEREGKPITLRTLAGHMSGLPKNIPDTDDLFKNADFDKLPNQLIERERGYDESRYLDALHGVRLASTPGSEFAYSNIGVKLIAFGLERVYGDTYANILERHILRPLHMPRTGLVVARRNQSLLVHGYGVSGGEMPHTLQNAGAAAGLYSTTEDLAKYASWQLAERDPIVRKSHDLIRGNIREFGVGLIWDEATANGERRLWHSGGSFGMSSQMELFPDAKIGIVLLANDGGFDTQNQLDKTAMSVRVAIKNAR
jgi:serine-type D-Ala-D-Ala carboxypeptidase/endopeptidase